MKGSEYKTCPKCAVTYSTLVRHKCFKPEDQKEKPKFDNPPEDDSNGQDESGKGDSGGKGDSKGQGGGGSKGDQQQDGDGQQQGDGEGQQGQGQGEGEGEGEGEGPPPPQPPEPEALPVVIVCTVLKYAALTAQCAKNGVISVEVSEDGLFVYGHNGEQTAFAVIPWSEFEQRSTVDGEFFVKDVIDSVDEGLIEATAEVIEETEVEKALKSVRGKEAKSPKKAKRQS